MKKGKLKKFTKVVESLEHEPVEMKGNKDLKDYAGMNPEAAKVMGWPDKDHAIELDEHQSEAVRVKNLVHETVEQEHMKQGDSYHDAHIEALKAETTVKTPEQLVNKVKDIRKATQGRAEAARDVHTVKVAGSSPAPATKSTEAEPMREGHPISEAENKAIHAWYGGHGGSRIKTKEEEEDESGKTLNDKLKVKTPRITPITVKTVRPIGKRPKIKTTPRRSHRSRDLGAGIIESRSKGGRRRHLKLT